MPHSCQRLFFTSGLGIKSWPTSICPRGLLAACLLFVIQQVAKLPKKKNPWKVLRDELGKRPKTGVRLCFAKGFWWRVKKFGLVQKKLDCWCISYRQQTLPLLPWCSATRRCFVFLRDGTILNLSRTSTSIWGESVTAYVLVAVAFADR